MGRFAQSKRTGGGPQQPGRGVLVEITTASIVTPTRASATYSADLNAAALEPSQYTSLPSGEQAIAIDQLAGDQIGIDFAGDISSDTSILYEGDTPGIRTPDNATYT